MPTKLPLSAEALRDAAYRAMRAARRHADATKDCFSVVERVYDEARDAHTHLTQKKDSEAKRDIKRLVTEGEEAATQAARNATRAGKLSDAVRKLLGADSDDATEGYVLYAEEGATRAESYAKSAKRRVEIMVRRFVK